MTPTKARAKPRPVWKGASELRRLLVPIDSLTPWPGNPRVGDVEVIAESLARSTQLKPIVVWDERGWIVAGNHLVDAARDVLGWTHVAAVRHPFASEDDARVFLLADNRSAELGRIDPVALLAQVEALRAGVGLEGTGYSDDDRRALEREVAKLRAVAAPPGEFPGVDEETDYCCPRCSFAWSGSPKP